MVSASSSYRSISGFVYVQVTSWWPPKSVRQRKHRREAPTQRTWCEGFCDVDNGLLKRTKKNHTQVYILNSLLKPRRYRSEYQGVCTMSHSNLLERSWPFYVTKLPPKNKFLKSPPPTKTTKTPPISDSKRSLLPLFGARAYSFCD